jgi:hypothetical protein
MKFLSRSSVITDKIYVATIRVYFGSGAIWTKFVHTQFNPLQWFGVLLQQLGYKYLYLTDLITRLFWLSLIITILI